MKRYMTKQIIGNIQAHLDLAFYDRWELHTCIFLGTNVDAYYVYLCIWEKEEEIL